MMFFKNRVVPPKPPSLVKFAARAASLNSGADNSTPISDQVPELMYAHDVPVAGTAAMAEPVSCAAGAITGAGFRPVSAATVVRSGPSTVPGCTSVPRICLGRPNAWTKPWDQDRVVGSCIWLVLASVYSLTFRPV